MDHKILVIDDDTDFIGILQRWLRDAGYDNTLCVTSGSDAVEALAENWDLVISDIYLPDMDGIEIARWIQLSNLDSRVLLMTGHLTTEVTLRALNQHVDGFLPKPFSRKDFLEKVWLLAQQSPRVATNQQRERVLAIGAHPDDVEIGCGGALLNHRDAGDDICILTLSNGECGGTSQVRSSEARRASEMLGAELIMADLEDTRISEGPDTINVISRAIEKFRPTTVYAHSLNDAHQDHRNAHRATLVAARNVPRLKCYQSPSSTIDFTPSHFEDITRTLIEKQALISCYRSQLVKCRYLKRSLIESTAEYWGRFAGYAKVEPLEIVRSA